MLTSALDGGQNLLEGGGVLLVVLVVAEVKVLLEGLQRRRLGGLLDGGLVAAVDVPLEVAAVGVDVEEEAGGAGEGVGDHAEAGGLQAPVVLLAVGLVREEALVAALKL